MLNYLRTLWRPAVYHGTGRTGNFFEGWFFKVVDHASANIMAFIPGISLGDDPHAFLQILDGTTHHASYLRFPIEDFCAARHEMKIQIGQNSFSSQSLQVDIKTKHQQIKGRLDFSALKPWPIKLASPGAMGWYAFVPFMECFHGVVSFDHALAGALDIDGATIRFDGGRGYIEKDWGRSFPSAYIWIQSNHFQQPDISLMASIANIPWRGRSFRGFIIGLWIKNQFYRFTTYNGAKLHYLKLTDARLHLQTSYRNLVLKLEALRTEGGLLNAPYRNQMTTRIAETLRSRVAIELYMQQKNDRQIIFSGEGNPAGLDVNGRLDDIIDGETHLKLDSEIAS